MLKLWQRMCLYSPTGLLQEWTTHKRNLKGIDVGKSPFAQNKTQETKTEYCLSRSKVGGRVNVIFTKKKEREKERERHTDTETGHGFYCNGNKSKTNTTTESTQPTSVYRPLLLERTCIVTAYGLWNVIHQFEWNYLLLNAFFIMLYLR